MRVGLLFADHDLELDALPPADADLVADLELERLFAAMSDGDERIDAVVRRVLPAGVAMAAALSWRQAVVVDALGAPGTVRAIYQLASGAVDAERRVWGSALRNAELVLRRSVEVLTLLLDAVERIRDVLAKDAATLRSPAMRALAERLATDADAAFMASARELLHRLDDPTLVVTAGLGPGNRSAGFVLRRAPDARARLRDRVRAAGGGGFAVDVALRDQNAMNALAELRSNAVAPAAGAVADAAAHLLAFCRRLRDETAFLVGCANLDASLAAIGVPRCTPELLASGVPGLAATGIVDPCLALAIGGGVVGNDLDTLGRPIVVVTGANGGGKSTLLRAVGVGRLLFAAGMPVPATSFRAGLHQGVLVHFPRGEAPASGGLLDAELGRLGALVGRAGPGSAVLLNEPLSSVNERDGSLIGSELVRGLVDGGAEVWLVTHHHDLATRLGADPPAPARFLRAERGSGAGRPFLVTEAPPLTTSFGADLWDAVLGPADGGIQGRLATITEADPGEDPMQAGAMTSGDERG